jgi:Lhr-like helicase
MPIAKGQIREVYYERVFNLGNYETFRIGLTATVGPKQEVDELIAMLDEYTV